MTRARAGALLFILFAALGGCGRLGEQREKPELLFLTSLPILFGEDFKLDQQSPPLLDAIETQYRLKPIDVTDPASLAKGKLLMLAQPRAQAPENLVALDEWVRHGGRVLLFADPRLDWPSERPLADPTRPPPMFADTGLLGHWGLRLDAPDAPGPVEGTAAGRKVALSSPGTLVGGCAITDAGLVARCRVGKGEAVIVADADLLNLEASPENREAVLGLLKSIEP